MSTATTRIGVDIGDSITVDGRTVSVGGASSRSACTTKRLAEAVHAETQTIIDHPMLEHVVAQYGLAYRARKLTPAIVLLAWVYLVLGALPSLGAVIRALRGGTIAGAPAVPQFHRAAFYQRLRSIPHQLVMLLLREVSRRMMALTPRKEAVRELAPFASGIYALDDTTLDKLAQKSALVRTLAQGQAVLGGRLGCLIDLTRGLYKQIVFDPDPNANEKNHLYPVIEAAGAGSLLVFDLGYFGYVHFDELTRRLTYFVTRLRKRTSYKVLEVLADGPSYRDQIVALGVHRADQAEYPVRLVELLVDGVWYSYLTNVLDPQMLPAPNVWMLYRLRWNIEKSFAAVKQALGLEHLHSSHQNALLMQIWMTLCLYQILQSVRVRLALSHKRDEDEVSWLKLREFLDHYGNQQAPREPLMEFLGRVFPILLKEGRRKRRRTELPAEVLKACRHYKRPSGELPTRKPRQGKPEPRIDQDRTITGISGAK